MTLHPFDPSRLAELMHWFPDRTACQTWGSLHFRFPFTEATFREDSRVDALPSWVLVDDGGALAGFGQYYLRVGRCHLARLAIAPTLRGQRHGERLIRELCLQGAAELSVGSYSLFVLHENARARALYERLGFAVSDYPEPMPELKGQFYMVAENPP